MTACHYPDPFLPPPLFFAYSLFHKKVPSLLSSLSSFSLFLLKSSESAFSSFFLFSFSSLSSFSVVAGVVSFGQGTAKTIKVGRVVAVLAIRALISSFLLSHICTCFGLCNSLGGHICGDSCYGRAKL